MIAFAAFHFEGHLLFATDMFHYISHDAGLGHGGSTHRELALISDEQHPFEGERRACFGIQTVHFQDVARGDTILFSTSFYDSIHKSLIKGRWIPPKTTRGV